MLAALNKAQKSIFGRLLGIFLITATCIFVVLAFSVKMAMKDGDTRRSKFANLFENHANYLINDIGIPPDLERAKSIAENSSIQIMIQGEDLLWKSSNNIISPNQIRRIHNISSIDNNHKQHSPSISMGRFKGSHFFIVKKQGYTYYLTGLHPFLKKNGHIWGWIALAICCVILYFSYLAVNWLIGPLKLIQQGAKNIEQGDISYRILCKRNDEIGEITLAVNSMANELEKMLEAKRQLLLAISHELRTPLTRAKLGIEFVENKKVRRSLNEDIMELDDLVTELLEAERLNQKHSVLTMTDIDICELINTSIREAEDSEKTIRTHLPGSTPVLQADSLRIKLLIKNIISNGLKYGNNKPFEVSVSYTPESLSIQFKDQGSGIDQQHLPHITEPFYRADSARQRQTGGYGLGLYLCKLIAEAHNGKLQISSHLGKGTTIRITLPLTHPQNT